MAILIIIIYHIFACFNFPWWLAIDISTYWIIICKGKIFLLWYELGDRLKTK